MNFIRCIVCSKVEGIKKLLIHKFDYLLKHSRRRKSIFVVMLRVKTREILENKKCAHVKHQILFVQIPINLFF